ncbi:MAG: protein-L-isoaspartate O-methyltransferase [Spirochaetia bacterium]|jgi:protein-L-isoaspartate(D-aspartate) O-methyltransferase
MSWEPILPEDDYRYYRENITLLEDRVVQSFPECYGNPAILSAIRNVPRHFFVNQGYKALAYTDNALPTCGDLTTSAPSVIARMIFQTGVSKGDKLLEIGTGTGYQAAVLAEMGVKVFTIEIDGSAVQTADGVLVRLGYKMDKRLKHGRGRGDALRRYRAIRGQFPQREPITLFWGNGQRGLAEKSPFKAIIVAASVSHLRHVWHLADQLSSARGTMVVPIGDRNEQSLAIVERTGDRIRLSTLEGVSFVFLRMILKRQDS